MGWVAIAGLILDAGNLALGIKEVRQIHRILPNWQS